MARFSQSTLIQLGGFDSDVLAEELKYGEDQYWNITITDGATPPVAQDLTFWQFQFRLIRRQCDSISDSRSGIVITGLAPAPGATEMNLDAEVKSYDPLNGRVRLLINDSFFSQVQPVIDTQSPPIYTGYFSAILPPVGIDPTAVDYIPQQTKKILLLFVITSDGITAQATI